MSAPRSRPPSRAKRPARRTARAARPRPAGDANADGHRLQKVMAAAGVGSRRHCEELIAAGRVEVDRKVVREQGQRVDPERQEIRVDGAPLVRSKKVYFLVNKPMGVVSTNDDPAGRPRVIDLFPSIRERLFTVGRLDLSSEGLMLVTNDGELANELAHPRYGVEKTYHVLVAGQPGGEVLAQLRQGVRLAEGVARVVSVKVKSALKKSTLLEIVLAEGRNREIRRLLAKVGHKVLRLKRVALGGVRLKDLPPGEFRRLRSDELRLLRDRSRPKPKRPPAEPLPEPSLGAAEPPEQAQRNQTKRNESKRDQAKPPRSQPVASGKFAAKAASRRPETRTYKKGRPGNPVGGGADHRGRRPKGRRP